MSEALTGISSMATRQILAEVAASFEAATGRAAAIVSVGGVDAGKRVRAGEAFDLVLLADDALAKLEAEGHVVAGSRVGFARSALAVAIRAGAPRPDFSDEAAVRAAILSAATIGYSTGPSGTYLLDLLKRWGIDEAVAPKLRQAPPGIPVGTMVARGEAELGFQQFSELKGLDGIAFADPLPPEVAFVTLFSGAVGAKAADPEGARAFLAHLVAPATAEIKHRNGMDPA